MGYGGSHQDAAQAIGRTNDGGIDGIISEDRLGLDKIYIQAKRWENTVGRPDIQQFKGALADQVAKKVYLLLRPILVRKQLNLRRNLELF
jgi:restriction system protein